MQRQHILLVEDNHKDRVALNQILVDLGFHVSMLQYGMDAEKEVTEDTKLVIVNHEAPGVEGAEFIQSLRDAHPEVELLYTTAAPNVENAVEAMKFGALDYLIKPLDLLQLKLIVERVFTKDDQDAAPKKKLKKDAYKEIVTQDKGVERLLDLVKQVADSNASILIQGESGTGKELFARHIHELSNRRNAPFVGVNCAALPENLLESELFGHEKGAFTGAVNRKLGKFEIAGGGTLLLDEITEMPFHLQSKLLRVIQEREIDRVGGLHPIKVDVRIVATTNRDIRSSIEKGEFREDLYYRLNIIPLKIPALRHRKGDIPLLARHFIEKYNKFDARNVKGLTTQASLKLESLTFSGNVREMENIIQRAVLLCNGEWIDEGDLFLDETFTSPAQESVPQEKEKDGYEIKPGPLKDVEKRLNFHTLDQTEGNRTHAAKILGISVRTLRNKLNEYKDQMSDY